jgi:hypothetical protein
LCASECATSISTESHLTEKAYNSNRQKSGGFARYAIKHKKGSDLSRKNLYHVIELEIIIINSKKDKLAPKKLQPTNYVSSDP